MRRQFATQADYYRHHRKCFELALELGCTPAEADKELRRIEARERDRAAMDRLEAKRNAAPTAPAGPTDFRRWDAPHMLRN